MNAVKSARDLLGRPIRKRRSGFEIQIQKLDHATLPARIERLKYLASIHPGGTFMFSMEMFHLLDEVKTTFVNGEYTATLLLSTAFIEHWLSGILDSKGFHKEARSGLKGIVSCLRKNKIGHEFLLAKIDQLRLVRNPFSHSKSFDHEHGLSQRTLEQRSHPDALLERDAKDAISMVYSVASAKY